MKRLAREPLVLFLILGALLFGAWRFIPSRASEPAKRILITRDRLAGLITRFSDTWGRPPSPPEVQHLIDDYVRQEVYCREAMALGFDRDDPLIRSQLVQNIQIVPDELAAQTEPTDDELNAFRTAHSDRFAMGRQFTFSQVYMNPEYHRESMAADKAKLRTQLIQAGSQADLAKFGDPYALPHQLTNAASSDVVKQFGERFTTRLNELPLGEWSGPVESRYGQHLVLVQARTPGRMPPLEEERGYARREWLDARREQKRKDFYESLRREYTVTIESPPAPAAAGKAPNTP